MFRPSYFFIASIVTAGSLWLSPACGPSSGTSVAEGNDPDKTASQVDTPSSPGLSLNDTATQSRGLLPNARVSIDFEKAFPALYALIQSQPGIVQTLKSYAQQVSDPSRFQTPDSYLQVAEMREDKIIPLLVPFFENMEPEQLEGAFQQYENELGRLGLQINMAEGMFTNLGPKRLFQDDLRLMQTASPIYVYDAFLDVATQARNGEYPYADMEPFLEMISLGERLKKSEGRVFFERVEENYRSAIDVLTDIHKITGDGARVGDLHTDAYPYMCSIENIHESLERFRQISAYPVIKKILDQPSEITDRPENVYLIVAEWASDEATAAARKMAMIDEQQDIPHILPIYQGNGQVRYANIFRFFEDETQANAAMDQFSRTYPDAQMIFVNVKGDKLYQIGI